MLLVDTRLLAIPDPECMFRIIEHQRLETMIAAFQIFNHFLDTSHRQIAALQFARYQWNWLRCKERMQVIFFLEEERKEAHRQSLFGTN